MLPMSKRHDAFPHLYPYIFRYQNHSGNDYRSTQLVIQLEPAVGLEDRDVAAVVILDSW